MESRPVIDTLLDDLNMFVCKSHARVNAVMELLLHWDDKCY